MLSFTQTTSAAKQVWGLTKGHLYRRGQSKSLQAIKVRMKVRSKSYLLPILRDSSIWYNNRFGSTSSGLKPRSTIYREIEFHSVGVVF